MAGASVVSRKERWRRTLFALALLAICILPVVLYLPFLNEPFQRDEGLYATVGRMLLHGDLPYRDSFDNKPPLVFVWYALSFLFLGEHVWAPRLVVSLLLSATTLVVYVEGKLLFSRRSGVVAALAFALSIGVAKLDINANTEFFLTLPLTGGLLVYTLAREKKHSGLYFLCGVLNGLAIITKETALFPFVFLMTFAAVVPVDTVTFRKGTLWMAIGAITVGLASLAPFVAAGAFSDFWDAAVVYTFRYLGDTSADRRLLGALLSALALLVFAGPWCLLSILAVFHARKTRGPGTLWLVAGWTAASYAAIALVGRFYSHYFVQTLPGMALLVPAGLVFVRDKMKRSRTNRIAYTFLLGSLTVMAITSSASVYLRSSPASRHLAKHPSDLLSQFEVDSPKLAAYIQENTSPDDLIYNLGFQSELYFYADRESPSKFLFDRPFGADESYIEDALIDLEAHPPTLIIDSARYDGWMDDHYDPAPFRHFIAVHYDYLGKIYYADVYRLRAAEVGQAH